MDLGIDKSFGAKVDLAFPESDQRQLFLIKFSSSDIRPAALARFHGGQIVLEGRNWAIVELGFNEAMGVRGTREVALVGGISLTAERFATFGRLTGLDPLQK
ncbi:hypothetical protein BH24ACT19_BH24ACT19_14000 [soil metagenome]